MNVVSPCTAIVFVDYSKVSEIIINVMALLYELHLAEMKIILRCTEKGNSLIR